MSQSVRYWDKQKKEYVDVTADTPLPVTGGGSGGTSDVNVQNWPTSQNVSVGNWPATQKVSGTVGVNNFPKWQAVGDMVSGEVQPGQEKLIDLSAAGVTAIEIQASPDNTSPVQVGNITGFPALWLKPGEARFFYYGKLYVSTTADAAQTIAYQAIKYG